VAVVAAYAAWTLPLLDLTEGRPAAALERLLAINTPRRPTAQATIALLAAGTLVEAAARADALEGMEPYVARFERWAQWDRRTLTQVVAHRCRALISEGEEAERHHQAALALFERLDASPWAERARGELRASGETARRRDASTREQLTPQELQVARLAGQGLSNLEIAEQLFVSPHTVRYHLPKVYTKLGITSRADLRQLDQNDGHDGG